jgi:SMODS and SLOG-associating 2TM effector domain 1
MSERGKELLRFYDEKRIKDQLGFYTGRLEHFDRATGQGLFISATILGFASAAGALAGTTVGWAKGWAAVAAILAAAATAIAAYLTLYAFDQQSKIYGDAVRAVRAASRLAPDPDAAPDDPDLDAHVAGLVNRVEQAMRQEQSQWGQLTSQMQAGDQTGG